MSVSEHGEETHLGEIPKRSRLIDEDPLVCRL